MLARITMAVERLPRIDALGAELSSDLVEFSIGEAVEEVDPFQIVKDSANPTLFSIAEESD